MGFRVNVNAGARSCIGLPVRMENDPTRRVDDAGSTLTVFIDPGSGELIDVPVGVIMGVTRA
jgi:hypothetical protein